MASGSLRVPAGKPADIDRAVAAARDAFDNGPWPLMAPAERIEWITKLSVAMAAHMDDLAMAITEAMGCPFLISQMMQALPASMALDQYAEAAVSYPFEEERAGLLGKVIRSGLGPERDSECRSGLWRADTPSYSSFALYGVR